MSEIDELLRKMRQNSYAENMQKPDLSGTDASSWLWDSDVFNTVLPDPVFERDTSAQAHPFSSTATNPAQTDCPRIDLASISDLSDFGIVPAAVAIYRDRQNYRESFNSTDFLLWCLGAVTLFDCVLSTLGIAALLDVNSQSNPMLYGLCFVGGVTILGFILVTSQMMAWRESVNNEDSPKRHKLVHRALWLIWLASLVFDVCTSAWGNAVYVLFRNQEVQDIQHLLQVASRGQLLVLVGLTIVTSGAPILLSFISRRD